MPIRAGAYTAHCQPCDAWSPDWDLRGAAQDVELLYVMGKAIASDSKDWPAWKPGSEFKAIRDQTAGLRKIDRPCPAELSKA
ncbi:hypothetical protein [Phenylobacterium sp.]|uniref:hypothetical protein n=1 Tax=Phenylobacterium sp. TaxID=1871053 RepID=UPI003BA981B6